MENRADNIKVMFEEIIKVVMKPEIDRNRNIEKLRKMDWKPSKLTEQLSNKSK